MILFSVGYEKRSLDELIGVLRECGVSVLVDVRYAPISRKKGFSKAKLSAALLDAGISYVHIKLAGNPFRNHENRDEALRLYADRLSGAPEIVGSVNKAFDGHERAAVLCFCAEHDRCHRGVLCQRLEERFGMTVIQIMPEATEEQLVLRAKDSGAFGDLPPTVPGV